MLFQGLVEKKKKHVKPWFWPQNQNQNQVETITMVWFGETKPWFWFAGLLV
jgi:hypothetical protein